jgi:hypothetical protein
MPKLSDLVYTMITEWEKKVRQEIENIITII